MSCTTQWYNILQYISTKGAENNKMYGRGKQDASEALDKKTQERLSVPANFYSTYKDSSGNPLCRGMECQRTMESHVSSSFAG